MSTYQDLNALMSTAIYKKIERQVEKFVKYEKSKYQKSRVGEKTIHDPIWGSVKYSAWEMEIIDTPFLQRLRNIHQVGLAKLTYPAARHSRFEHSLGVNTAAKQMCEHINSNNKSFRIDSDVINQILLAALLHDIGHCCFSHLSEQIYGESPSFLKLIDKFNFIISRKPKAHEVLAFVIINTKTFVKFFMENISFPPSSYPDDKQQLFQNVGMMIIGADIEEASNIDSYKTAIINGPFDADKLDYIMRDTITAGLSLTYDIERLFNKIMIQPIPKNDKVENRLVISFNGVTAIEELTFCKIMLFSYIYYHQKVLISEYMVEDYLFALSEMGIIKDMSDFLKYDDNSILSLYKEAKDIAIPEDFVGIDLEKLSTNILERHLPKRCFEVSMANVEYFKKPSSEKVELLVKIVRKIRDEPDLTEEDLEKEIKNIYPTMMQDGKTLLNKLVDDVYDKRYADLLARRKELYDLLVIEYKRKRKKVKFTPFDIFIVFKKDANYGSAREEIILGKDKKTLYTINDFIKLDDWAASFNSNKWRGYVFVSENIDRKLASHVCEKYILKDNATLKSPMFF